MQLIQFDVYFNHYMHIIMVNYITYAVRVCAWKIIKLVAFVLCVCTEDNSVLLISKASKQSKDV